MNLKKLLGCSLAAAVGFSNVMGASAATLRDIFDADYYGSRYPDLREAFEEDILKLWNHYRTTGALENREARDEEIVAAEKEAAREAAQKANSQASSQIGSQGGPRIIPRQAPAQN